MKINNDKGTTLVELILYIGLLSIILSIMVQFLGSIYSVRIKSEETTSLVQDTRFINSKLKDLIGNAGDIQLPSNNGQTLNTITLGNSTQLYLNNGNLVHNINGNEIKLNSNNTTLNNISFTRIETSQNIIININYEIQSEIINKGENKTKDINLTIGVR
jgi:type II secretory pathway pseudopilin PulG